MGRILRFTKGPHKIDILEFLLDSKKVVTINNPKQGILPHDMIHSVVEKIFGLPGFIDLVFQGFDPDKTMEVLAGFAPQITVPIPPSAWIAESIVESMQAALWSNNSSFSDFLYTLGKTCEGRGITTPLLKESDYLDCREQIRTLNERWNQILVNETLTINYL